MLDLIILEALMPAAGAVYVLVCAVCDIRSRRINSKGAICVGGLALLCNLWLMQLQERTIWDLGAALLPGVFLILVSLFTREKIGYGDGVCIVVLGLFAGAQITFCTMLTAMLLSALWSALLLILGKAGRDTRIPWLPFAAAGYCLVGLVALYA